MQASLPNRVYTDFRAFQSLFGGCIAEFLSFCSCHLHTFVYRQFFFCIYKRKGKRTYSCLICMQIRVLSLMHCISLFLKKKICSFVAFKFLFRKRKRIVFYFFISYLFTQSFCFNFESKHHTSFTPLPLTNNNLLKVTMLLKIISKFLFFRFIHQLAQDRLLD